MVLAEVLDREAGASLPPTVSAPAILVVCLDRARHPNEVLLTARHGESFGAAELEYAVAAGHYLSLALERAQAWDEQAAALERLSALVAVGRQLAEQRETIPLLEHIAEQAARLLGCERSSIFLWDQARRELVGRPALGLPGNELRVPDNEGVVGKVLQTGQVVAVNDTRGNQVWNPQVDNASGFTTYSLLCVPLLDAAGRCLGALEVLNKHQGDFTGQDVTTLQHLAAYTAVALQNVRERETLIRSHEQLEAAARVGTHLIGQSPAIRTLRETAERLAGLDLPVLLQGESGTGKEVLARFIHYGSRRQKHPFVPINCAAIAETLLESELFGHEKGAFTGADALRKGKFELASGGTLFLDEIGDLSPGGQAKLLRVLEEKAVYRVGGSQPVPIDTRILAATNCNLAEAVRLGKFRQDLFFRLTVVTLDLPPLRERRDDIPLLVDHFLQHFCRDAGRRPLQFAADACRRLEQHDWPGNVRELRNLLERIVFLCPKDRVEVNDLPFLDRLAGTAADPFASQPLREATEAFQRAHIRRAIDQAAGNMSDAARLLGLHRTNLYRKMRLLGMDGH
jgi:Nif-specific regulatory protein